MADNGNSVEVLICQYFSGKSLRLKILAGIHPVSCPQLIGNRDFIRISQKK